MYRGCIFDLDGTIINTIHSLAYTVSLTMAQYGYRPVDESHTKLFVGDGYKKLVERSLIYSGDRELIHYDEALVFYDEKFKQYCLYQLEPYEGVLELLRRLKDRKIKIGVVTNKDQNRAIECVEMIYGKGFFDLVTGERKGIKCKPDPSGVLMTAEYFGISPSECLYFGDTDTDMKTGINAGMDTVGVTWGFRERSELEAFYPKYIINHPSEIISVLE